jgi:hypothetical protein
MSWAWACNARRDLAPRGGEVAAFLTWDDRFRYVERQLRPVPHRAEHRPSSPGARTFRSGSQNPVESLDYVNAGNTDSFSWLSRTFATRPRRGEPICCFEPECHRRPAPAGREPARAPQLQHAGTQRRRAGRRLAGRRERHFVGAICSGRRAGGVCGQRGGRIMQRSNARHDRVFQQPGAHARRAREA